MENFKYIIDSNSLRRESRQPSELMRESLQKIGLYSATGRKKEAYMTELNKHIAYTFYFDRGTKEEKAVKVLIDSKDSAFKLARMELKTRYANIKKNERTKIATYAAAIVILASGAFTLTQNIEPIKAYITSSFSADPNDSIGAENIEDYKNWSRQAEIERAIEQDQINNNFYLKDEIESSKKR